jgi:hypothetical protein
MDSLVFILRDRREELRRHWQSAVEGVVGDEYRAVLESPVGDRLLRGIIEDLVTYAQAEDFKVEATLREICERVAREAAGRLSVGFALADLLAALHALRAAVWGVLIDALVTGVLPPPGETMAQMKVIDGFIDALVTAVAEVGR